MIFLYAPRLPVLALTVLAGVLALLMGRYARVLAPLQLLVCLVVLFPVMGFRAGRPRASALPIRLVTYNVYYGKLDRASLVDEIAAMRADIILLQAAYVSMDAHLKERLPERSIHEAGEFLLLTRFPIAEAEIPPRLPDGTLAQFVRYVLETDAGPLRVFNIHPFSPRSALFDARAPDESTRRREEQVDAVVRAARAESTPFVIAGDTNLPVLSSIARRSFRDMHDAFDDVGFGFGYTFPARRPWMRIDRALASRHVRFVDARVGGLGASDHRPLFVDFELGSGR